MSTDGPVRIESASGLRFELNANGSIRRIDHGDIILNLFPGTEIEGGPANIYLRRRGFGIESMPLLGPCSPSRIYTAGGAFVVDGEWNAVRYRVELTVSPSAAAWFWHVRLHNAGNAEVTVDLIHAQDLGLAHYGAVRSNEYYVSHYVDHTPLTHPERGFVVASRQNLAMGGRHPWSVIGSLANAVGFATDALQLHGLNTRAGRIAAGLQSDSLPNSRRQHEHSMAVLQDAPVTLSPDEQIDRGFFGWFEGDHEAPTSVADLALVDKALLLNEARPPAEVAPIASSRPPAPTLFSSRPLLPVLDLNESEIAALFGADHREVESEDGRVLSFFAGVDRHVVLRAKELAVLRPHGHIVRTGDRLVPDEESLTSTMWMAGVFNSLVTQGHVNINRFLSTTRSYLSLQRAGGQRIFVERDDGYYLLDVPSAFEMTPGGCRWIYKHEHGLIEVRSRAGLERHEIDLAVDILAGAPRRFLVSHHVALNGDDGAEAIPAQFVADAHGVTVSAFAHADVGRRFPRGYFRIDTVGDTRIDNGSDDEILFVDGDSRRQPFIVLVTAPAAFVAFRITGHLIRNDAAVDVSPPLARSDGRSDILSRVTGGSLRLHPPVGSVHAGDVARLQEILPWYAHDALIHYLAPRGLEQYSGGGWGTRDVCQGPAELLLASGQWPTLRDLLLRVFKHQNADGDWPQWFMFFDRERKIRPGDSHGDIVFWPVLALAQYLLASEDGSILGEKVPFFHADGDDHAERTSLWGHVERALDVIGRRVIPGTYVAAYGHGDWNDSLQPADPSMSEQLCSAWTVTLHYQTLCTLAAALRRLERPELAAELEANAQRVHADFQRLLIADEVVAGFAYFHTDGRVDHLLHPRDTSTGIHYRLLPMIHGILSRLFTPAQAQAHVGYIRRYLLAPDGARLFDRPPLYRGGRQRHFQRAESTPFFGRENGLMYMHAHLRYAEAMAHLGDADAFFHALRQANPIGIGAVVSTARRRQANCYYSSSDAELADRYAASVRYDELKAGGIPFEGGWRVYSSGAGIACRIILQCFLGIRRGRSVLGIDPVMPRDLDGLRAEIEIESHTVDVVYRVGADGFGPTRLELNGAALAFERTANPYRRGGVEVRMETVRARMSTGENTLVVHLG